MHVPLLIVGAGPFGLAMAAYARGRGWEHAILGEPMEFWKRLNEGGITTANLRRTSSMTSCTDFSLSGA